MSHRPPAIPFCQRLIIFAAWLGSELTGRADTINAAAPAALPDVGPSMLRVFGALALVIGIFLGGVWLFRNWQRLALQHGRRPKLNIIETRPLGGRQALYVVGYDQGGLFIASSPAGVSLLSHLPDAAAADESMAAAKSAAAFPLLLSQMLKAK